MGYVIFLGAWIITFAFALLMPRPANMPVVIKAGVVTLLVAVFTLVTFMNSFYQVSAGHVGLVYCFGDIVNSTGPGAQYVRPWCGVTEANTQTQSRIFRGDNHLASFSKKSQDVYVDVTVNFRVDPVHIVDLYRTVGPKYVQVLIDPRVKQVFKDETVKYDTVQIAPNRENIRHSVTNRLVEQLKARSIIIEDVLMDNLSFNKDFQRSIEEAQQAEQNALKEQNNIVKSKAIADQEIEKARGAAEAILLQAVKQAEANKKLAESISDRLIQYQAVQKLSPNIQVMMLPSGGSFIMPSDIFKQQAVK
jgi:regulator of protease activity HflC (stomatin/prohibitin superfamily)